MSFFGRLCVHVSVCFAMHALNWSALFSQHSCNWTGLMCNPSRHFKGREAWTDVVLLVHQMGLYDEKSIIPIQASLPSPVHNKALHSFFFFFIARNNLFLYTPDQHSSFVFLSSFSCFLCISVAPLLFCSSSISPSSPTPHPDPPSPTLSWLLKTCKCGIS